MDYYKSLGVQDNASANEIKAAYRRLSLKYHPDRPGGDEEQFKKISQAYEILSNEEKRQVYDMQRRNPFFRGGGGASTDNDILNMLFGMGGMGGMGGIPFQMGMNRGAMPHVQIFRNGVPVSMSSSLQRPTPIIKKITISLAQAFTGCTIPLEVERWVLQNSHTKQTEKEKIYVEIPRGIDTNEIIPIRGKGNVINDNNKGDIKVFVTVHNNTEFKRHGLDLIYTKKISLKEALVGLKFSFTYINDKPYTITSGGKVISPGYEDVNPGMGFSRGENTGNLIIRFIVDFPNQMTDVQKEALTNIL